MTNCETCNGTGKISWGITCSYCDGRGENSLIKGHYRPSITFKRMEEEKRQKELRLNLRKQFGEQ